MTVIHVKIRATVRLAQIIRSYALVQVVTLDLHVLTLLVIAIRVNTVVIVQQLLSIPLLIPSHALAHWAIRVIHALFFPVIPRRVSMEARALICP